jgi:hypothetical protein
VHTDALAGASANALRANAYALGSHIVSGAGKYEPNSQQGRHLLGHELAHIVQQGGYNASPPATSLITVGATSDPLEHEADQVATAAINLRRGTRMDRETDVDQTIASKAGRCHR